MKEKTKKEVKKELKPTIEFEDLKNMPTGFDTGFWVLSLLLLTMGDIPKDSEKQEINIYVGSDK